MDAWNSLEIPGSLQEGQRYYLRQARGDGQAAELAPVTFLAYTSCPAAGFALKKWTRGKAKVYYPKRR